MVSGLVKHLPLILFPTSKVLKQGKGHLIQLISTRKSNFLQVNHTFKLPTSKEIDPA